MSLLYEPAASVRIPAAIRPPADGDGGRAHAGTVRLLRPSVEKEICVRRGRIADEEAQGLPDPHRVADHERPGCLVRTKQAAVPD
jgi:hypothetical protein